MLLFNGSFFNCINKKVSSMTPITPIGFFFETDWSNRCHFKGKNKEEGWSKDVKSTNCN